MSGWEFKCQLTAGVVICGGWWRVCSIKSRQWAIFKTSAIKGEGLFEGLDWLANTLSA